MLFLHGLHSSQRNYRKRAERVADEIGVVCLTMDLAGHGDSDGNRDLLSPRDHLHDAVAALDRLSSVTAVDQSRVGICGASYGGYLAAQLVGRRRVARLFLRAPALLDDTAFDVPLGKRSPSPEPQAPVFLDRLARYQGEVMVLEGEKDEVVRHETIERYLEAAHAASHVVIPDATHELAQPAWNQTFVDAVINWFRPM